MTKVKCGDSLESFARVQGRTNPIASNDHLCLSVFEKWGRQTNSSIPAEVVEYLAVDMGAMGGDQQRMNTWYPSVSGPYHYSSVSI